MPTSFELTPQMMREIIMDHYGSPRNKMTPTGGDYETLHSKAVNCIDDINVFLKMKDGKVEDAKWDGVACAISTSSTDILCDLMVGKSLDEANYIMAQYDNMINEKPYDSSVLDEALAFTNTHKQAARIHCATIGWEAMHHLINKDVK